MKTKLSLLASVLILFLATIASHAIVIFQDSFPYAAGPLATNNPTWMAPPGNNTATSTFIEASGSSSVVMQQAAASVQAWALFTNGAPGYSITLPNGGLGQAITNFSGTFYYFPSNGPVAALYASFTINVSSAITNANGTYFAMFLGTNFGLHPRMYVCTNTAGSGNYRMGIINNSSPSTLAAAEIVPLDLTYGNTYNVVFKQVLATGLSTLWVGPSNPANETITANSISPAAASSSVSLGGPLVLTDTTGTNVPSVSALAGFGFHTLGSVGTGTVTIGPVICGTTFEDVVPASAGSNPPFITIPPANTTNFTGQAATLSVVAGGDTDGLTYQWYGPSGLIGGANSSSYTIPSIAAGNEGNYYVVIANNALPAGVTSANAYLHVLTGSALPTISSGPSSTAVTVDGTATFTVTATDGGAPMTYQWYFGSTMITNQTNSTLSLAAVGNSQAGAYHVVVSNINGPTTSSNATLTINPPATVDILYLHSLVDTNFAVTNTTTLYTVQGTVTTWHDMTTPGNSEFYIQDASGGIAVFWGGAASSTNLPPAGAIVKVVAPLSQFDSLVELAPVFGNPFQSVTILSTNNPLPTPLPVPFDQNVITNATNMVRHIQGSYMVASNVFLQTDDSPTFNSVNSLVTNGFLGSQVVSEPFYTSTGNNSFTTGNLTFTNLSGATFTIFYNAQCDYIGQPKPTGPVTVYGIMGQFSTTTPYTNGYELTPSRIADIVPAVAFTNIISNIVRYGDLPTNSFSQNVLQPGEKLTMTVVAYDPGGGTVTLSGLSGNGTWSGISGNGTTHASVIYTYTGSSGAAGTSDTPSLSATFSSTGLTVPYTWSIYNPTADEQNVRITEVLPFSSANNTSPAYNPLQRPTGDGNANDDYIEIANLNSSDTVSVNRWKIYSGGTQIHSFVSGELLGAGTCGVVFGGDTTNAPALSTASMVFLDAANGESGISLGSSSGTVSLYDNLGNLVDRVAYPASGSASLNPASFNTTGQSSANYPLCSFSRFPTLNSPLVPQAFISTNYVSPGAQYNGTSWAGYPASPAGVSGITAAKTGGSVTLHFTAQTVNATTLWLGNDLSKPFSVLAGGVFPSTTGTFTITNAPATSQFYFITTQ